MKLRSDFEGNAAASGARRSGPSSRCRAINIACGVYDNAGVWIPSISAAAEVMEGRIDPTSTRWCQFKDRAKELISASVGGPVQVPRRVHG